VKIETFGFFLLVIANAFSVGLYTMKNYDLENATLFEVVDKMKKIKSN